MADPSPPASISPLDEWTCGHRAGAVCAECYRRLADKAHQLAMENLELRAIIAKGAGDLEGARFLRAKITEAKDMIMPAVVNITIQRRADDEGDTKP